MESWQHQCCGTPFSIGDVITWPVAAVTADGLSRMLGEVGEGVRLNVERHDDQVQELTGTVLAIQSVFYEMEWVEQHPDGPHGRAAADSGVLVPVRESARSEHRDHLTWSGYLVELDAAEPSAAL